MWENAMRGAQAATNYLLSFISTPPPTVEDKRKQTESFTEQEAEHEENVLAAWQRKSTAVKSPRQTKTLLSQTAHISFPKESSGSILNEQILSKVNIISVDSFVRFILD